MCRAVLQHSHVHFCPEGREYHTISPSRRRRSYSKLRTILGHVLLGRRVTVFYNRESLSSTLCSTSYLHAVSGTGLAVLLVNPPPHPILPSPPGPVGRRGVHRLCRLNDSQFRRVDIGIPSETFRTKPYAPAQRSPASGR